MESQVRARKKRLESPGPVGTLTAQIIPRAPCRTPSRLLICDDLRESNHLLSTPSQERILKAFEEVRNYLQLYRTE